MKNKFVTKNYQIFLNLASFLSALATVLMSDIKTAVILVIFNIALLGVTGALNRLVDAAENKG